MGQTRRIIAVAAAVVGIVLGSAVPATTAIAAAAVTTPLDGTGSGLRDLVASPGNTVWG